MKLKQRSVIQIIRHIIQFAAFLLFPELFITALHALGDVVTSLTDGTFSFSALSAQIMTIVAVFAATAVWGGIFCGYLCSFGAMQELALGIFQGIFHRKIVIPERIDHVLQYLKDLVLVFIVVGLWIMDLTVNASLSPWGIFGMMISGNFSVMAAAVHTLGFGLLLIFLTGSLFVERFFCKYFCPLGALFTVFSGKRCYKIRRDAAVCVNCGLCEKNCSMGVQILKEGDVSSGNCIDCMKCLTICPKECLSANPAPAAAGTAAAIVTCGLVQIGNLTVPDDITSSAAYSFEETGKGSYTDGVYTGVGAGFRGDTEVQVTVENGYITDITVLSYEDDTEFFQKAQSTVPGQIISEQSIDVQGVSGATFSSNSIIDAVANALGIEKQSETDYSVSSDERQADPDQSADSGQSADNGQFGTESEEDDSSALELSSVADGTYHGEGEGFRGTTSVSVTVESGKITDITVTSYEDDETFFDRAEDTVISEIISAQSLDVPCVSGATFSSNGILEAVADALNVSFDNPNQYSSDNGGHRKGEFGKRRH